MTSQLWLIGAGSMAQAYAAVLQAHSVQFHVIGRSLSSAESFRKSTGIDVYVGGVQAALANFAVPDHAVIAVSVDQLASTAIQLLNAGCHNLLLEKPGALSYKDLKNICELSKKKRANVWIAYNRRYYATSQKLHELISVDGGITSAMFEFTEWSHLLRNLKKDQIIMENWVLANSSHVIDLAFHFIGYPSEGDWNSFVSGSLDWHPASSRFHGAGMTERGIPFSYRADWEAPGRWGVEICTRQNRYILRPMEELQAIKIGSVEAKRISLDNSLDLTYKPGLFRQCEAFLSPHKDFDSTFRLCSVQEQLDAFPTYCRIAGYKL